MRQIGFSQNGNSNIPACSSRTPSGVRVYVLCPWTWQVFVTGSTTSMCWKWCQVATEAGSEKPFSPGSLHLSEYMPLQHSHHVVRKSRALGRGQQQLRQCEGMKEPSATFQPPGFQSSSGGGPRHQGSKMCHPHCAWSKYLSQPTES